MPRWLRANPDRVDSVLKCKCRQRGLLFLRCKYSYRLETNRRAPPRGTFSDQTHRYRPPRRSLEKYSTPRRDPIQLPRGFSSFVTEIVGQPLRLPALQQLTKREPRSKRGEFLFCAPRSLRSSAKILDHTPHVLIRFFEFRSALGVRIAFDENLRANAISLQGFLEHRAKQLAFKGMRANVRICDRTRIDLASHHKCSTADPATVLPIAGDKRRNRFLRDASHHTHAPIYFAGVCFQFSRCSVVWLSRLRKSRIGQIDPPDIAELRRMSWTRQQHCSRPAGFYSKAESGSLQLYHLV